MIKYNILKIVSATLALTLAFSSIAYAGETQSENILSVQSTDDELEEYTVNAQFHQTLARYHADLINEFRMSDEAWYWNQDGTEKVYTDKYELTYDYDLEKIAMQRAAELLFQYNHLRPDHKTHFGDIEWGSNIIIGGENIGFRYITDESDEQDEKEIFEAFREDVDDAYNDWCIERGNAGYAYSYQGHRRNMLGHSKTFAVAHASYGRYHVWVHLFGWNTNNTSEYTEPCDSKKEMTVEVNKEYIVKSDEPNEEGRNAPYGTTRLGFEPNTFIIGRDRVVIPNDSFFEPEEEYDNSDELAHADPNNYKDYEISPTYSQTKARGLVDTLNNFRTSDTWWYNDSNVKEDIAGNEPLKYDYGLEQLAMQRASELFFREKHIRPNDESISKESYVKFIADPTNEQVLEKLQQVNYLGDYMGNRRNLLKPEWKYFGIARAKYNGKTYIVLEYSDEESNTTVSNPIAGKTTFKVNVYTPLLDTGDVVIPSSESDNSNNDDSNNNDDNNNQSDYETYTLDVKFNQTRARKHADLLNEFRTSDTWYYKNRKGDIQYVSGLNTLTYDYGLEKCAMQRAAEVAFRTGHQRPNNKWVTDGTLAKEIYHELETEIYIGENITGATFDYSPEEALEELKETNYEYEHQGHRRTMLNNGYKYFGVACINYSGNVYPNDWVYVQIFSQEPLDSNYTEAFDSTKTMSVEVYKPLIKEKDDSEFPSDFHTEYVVIPKGAKDSNGNTPNPGNDSSNPGDDDSNPSISNNNLRSSYKTKIDISSLIPSDGAVKVKYKSSDKKIAKVNKKGIVTGGKKAGTATITKLVKYDKKGSWETAGSITITNYYPKLPKKQQLSVGGTLSMNSLLTGMDETPVDWESSKPSVVTVTSDGLVTAIGKGSAKLTPIFSLGKAKVKTTIKVK